MFIRTAEDFQKHLDKLTNNKFEIEILTIEKYQDKYCDGIICDPFTELKEGRVQVSQLYSEILGDFDATNFYALSMPYLFRDHDHASKVFEGEIGQDLFKYLHAKTNVRGLSYTYSGGYRCTASETPIKSIADFAGKKMLRSRNPIHADMIDMVGGEKVFDTDGPTAEVVQTTLPRYHVDASKSQKYVTDTKHSMYLTAILMNDNFWNSLSAEDQASMKTAGLNASRTERKKSVADADFIKENRAKQEELGIDTMIELSDSEIEKLSNIWAPLYDKYENFFGDDILNKIKNS